MLTKSLVVYNQSAMKLRISVNIIYTSIIYFGKTLCQNNIIGTTIGNYV